jgi:hypothetical protein
MDPGSVTPKYQYGEGCLSDQLLGQWFAEVVGGLLLIVVALAAYFFFHVPAQFGSTGGTFMLLVMVLPPLLAGVLLVVNCWAVYKGKAAPPKPAT